MVRLRPGGKAATGVSTTVLPPRKSRPKVTVVGTTTPPARTTRFGTMLGSKGVLGAKTSGCVGNETPPSPTRRAAGTGPTGQRRMDGAVAESDTSVPKAKSLPALPTRPSTGPTSAPSKYEP